MVRLHYSDNSKEQTGGVAVLESFFIFSKGRRIIEIVIQVLDAVLIAHMSLFLQVMYR